MTTIKLTIKVKSVNNKISRYYSKDFNDKAITFELSFHFIPFILFVKRKLQDIKILPAKDKTRKIK